MRIDFYQLTRDPVEKVATLLASKVLGAGERLLIVSSDAAQREAISLALWDGLPGTFLANGQADATYAPRQPVLIAADCNPANGAANILLADGVWRDDAKALARAFLLFGDDTLPEARKLWRSLDDDEAAERHFWKQEGGRWAHVA